MVDQTFHSLDVKSIDVKRIKAVAPASQDSIIGICERSLSGRSVLGFVFHYKGEDNKLYLRTTGGSSVNDDELTDLDPILIIDRDEKSMGIGTTDVADESSILELKSTSKGFLPSRMTTTQKNAISSPATGLVVYDTTLDKLCVYTGAAWETITSS